MGFEVWLVADPTRAKRIPALADVETLFEGFVLSRSEQFHYLEVGTSVVDSCEIRFSATDPQLVLGVSRPCDSDWLWERLFRLLEDYDLFMWWGDVSALVARSDVPTPPEMALTKVRISDATELHRAVGAA